MLAHISTKYLAFLIFSLCTGDSIPSRALALAKEKMFSTAYGMRLDKQKILLFITNGKEPQFMLPFDIPIEEPLNAAKALGMLLIFLKELTCM